MALITISTYNRIATKGFNPKSDRHNVSLKIILHSYNMPKLTYDSLTSSVQRKNIFPLDSPYKLLFTRIPEGKTRTKVEN